MPVSKPFAIATEGATTDGRVITAEWIKQMAESYDQKAYTALGNLEHYISMLPDSVFSAYGKVVALSTRTAEILGEKKLQLLATFDANDAIVALQKAGKKMFCSIEVNPDFAKRGKAYLQGLAFTDNPASLGTEVMQFAAKAEQNPFASRKRDPANLFSAAQEVSIEWEAGDHNPSAGDTLFNKVKDLLGLGKKDSDARFADQADAITTVAESQKQLLDRFAKQEKTGTDFAAQLKTSTEKLEAMSKDFAELKETLGNTDGDNKTRPNAAGGDGLIKTDC